MKRRNLCKLPLAAVVTGGAAWGLATGAVAAPSPRVEAASDADLLAAARKEGALTWYGVDLPYNQVIVELFKARHPEIKLEAWLSGGLQVAQKFVAQKEARQDVADCLTAGVAELFPEYRRRGFLAPIGMLPNAAALPPWTRDPNDCYFFYGSFKVGIIFNERLLRPDEVPTSYRELADPKWAGRVAIVDPSTGGFGLPFFRFVAAQPSLGPGWIKSFGSNRPLLSFRASQLTEAVATGMRPIGLLRDTEAQGAKARGAPVGFRIAKEGFLLHLMPIAISSTAPHPNAARYFVNWLMSANTQKYLEQQGVGLPTRTSQKDFMSSGAWVLDIESISAADTRDFLATVTQSLKP